jgi:hypothetical protein
VKPEKRDRLIAIVIALIAAWSAITLVTAVSRGPRESDPGIYWAAVVLIGLVTAGLVALFIRRWGAQRQP